MLVLYTSLLHNRVRGKSRLFALLLSSPIFRVVTCIPQYREEEYHPCSSNILPVPRTNPPPSQLMISRREEIISSRTAGLHWNAGSTYLLILKEERLWLENEALNNRRSGIRRNLRPLERAIYVLGRSQVIWSRLYLDGCDRWSALLMDQGYRFPALVKYTRF